MYSTIITTSEHQSKPPGPPGNNAVTEVTFSPFKLQSSKFLILHDGLEYPEENQCLSTIYCKNARHFHFINNTT